MNRRVEEERKECAHKLADLFFLQLTAELNSQSFGYSTSDYEVSRKVLISQEPLK